MTDKSDVSIDNPDNLLDELDSLLRETFGLKKDIFTDKMSIILSLEDLQGLREGFKTLSASKISEAIYLEKLLRNLSHGNFSWDNYQKDFSYYALEKIFYLCNSPSRTQVPVLPYSHVFREVFKPADILRIFQEPYDPENLEFVAQFKTSLIRGFYYHYFCFAMSTSASIDFGGCKNLSPFSRNEIRMLSNANEWLNNNLFTEEFNLKEFVFEAGRHLLFKLSYVWCQDKELGFFWVFELMRAMFDYGLYEVPDIEGVLEFIINETNQLKLLEDSLLELLKYENEENREKNEYASLKKALALTRENIATIITQIYFLVNDKAIADFLTIHPILGFKPMSLQPLLAIEQAFLSKTEMNDEAKDNMAASEKENTLNPRFPAKRFEAVKNFMIKAKKNVGFSSKMPIFFIDRKEIVAQVGRIISSYILAPTEMDNFSFITSDTSFMLESIIFPLFIYKLDQFLFSINMIVEDEAVYYYKNQKERVDSLTVEGLLVDISKGITGGSNRLLATASLNLFVRSCGQILKILNEAELNDPELYTWIKIFLAERNFQGRALLGFNTHFSQMSYEGRSLVIKAIVKSCENCNEAKVVFLSHKNKKTFEYMIEKSSYHLVFILDRIFLKSSAILFQIHNFLDFYIEEYQTKLSSFFESPTLEIKLTLILFNKLTDEIVQGHNTASMAYKKLSIGTKIAKMLHKLVLEKILPFFMVKENFEGKEYKSLMKFEGENNKLEQLWNPEQPLSPEEDYSLTIDTYISLCKIYADSSRNIAVGESWVPIAMYMRNLKTDFSYLWKSPNKFAIYTDLLSLELSCCVFPQSVLLTKRTSYLGEEMSDNDMYVERDMFRGDFLSAKKAIMREIQNSEKYLNMFEQFKKDFPEASRHSVKLAKYLRLYTYKLCKGIFLSRSIVGQEAGEILKELIEIAQCYQRNYDSLRKILNLKNPNIKLFADEEMTQVQTITFNSDQEAFKSLEPIERSNPTTLEIRTLCLKIMDNLMENMRPGTTECFIYDSCSLSFKSSILPIHKINHMLAVESSFAKTRTRKEKPKTPMVRLNYFRDLYFGSKEKHSEDPERFNVFSSPFDEKDLLNLFSYITSILNSATYKGVFKFDESFNNPSIFFSLFFLKGVMSIASIKDQFFYYIEQEMVEYKDKKGYYYSKTISSVTEIHNKYWGVTWYFPFHSLFWRELQWRFMNASDIVHNFCEHNNMNFKAAFGYCLLWPPPSQDENEGSAQEVDEENMEDEEEIKQQTVIYSYFQVFSALFSKMRLNENSNCREDVLTDQNNLVDTGCKMLQTLMEMLTGPCLSNQLKIYSENHGVLKPILMRDLSSIEGPIWKFKFDLMSYLNALIEGLNPKIIEKLVPYYDPHEMMNLQTQIMKKLFTELKKQEHQKTRGKRKIYQKSDGFQKADPVTDQKKSSSLFSELKSMYFKSEGFSHHLLFRLSQNIFSFCQNLASVNAQYSTVVSQWDSEWSKFKKGKTKKVLDQMVFYGFLRSTMTCVEIIGTANEDESSVLPLIKVYFARPPECKFLSKETKTEVFNQVNVDSQESKILSFFEKIDLFDIEMVDSFKLYKSHPFLFFTFTRDNFKKLEILNFIISLITSGFFLGTYGIIITEKGFRVDTYAFWIVKSLGIMELLISSLSLVGWLITAFLMEFKIQKTKYLALHVNNMRIGPIFNLKIVFLTFRHTYMQPFFFYFIFSLLFINLHSPWIFSLTLLNLYSLSTTTRYVVHSVTKQLSQLLITMVYGLFIILSFTLFVAEVFPMYIDAGDLWDKDLSDMDSNFICKNMFSCFLYVINQCVRESGIGEVLRIQGYDDSVFFRYVGRFILDIMFFILINVILLNVIFGIILDTFASLRDQQQAREEDIRTRCLVCGIDRYQFAKQQIDFVSHYEHNHNLWKYMYFIIYLRRKDKTEFNGLEYTVNMLSQGKEITFFPIGRSLELGKFIPKSFYFIYKRKKQKKAKKRKRTF